MDKFLRFIKNKWFLLGISFLSLLYTVFLAKMVQLTFTSCLIITPVVVSAFIFLACGVGEAFKTVAGTLFLMMFVVGGLVYSVFVNFDISLRYVLVDQIYGEDQELEHAVRNTDYLTSGDGRYRLVTYTKDRDGKPVTEYYVEEAFRDEEYPFGIFRRSFG